MKQSWKKKGRQGLMVLLTAILLAGAWGVPTGAQTAGARQQATNREEAPEYVSGQPEQGPGDSGGAAATQNGNPLTFAAKTVGAANTLQSAKLNTSQYLLIYPAADKKYRWNTNGTGKNACVHLDTNGGHDCTMKFNLETSSGGVYYYSIKYSGSGYYIDSEHDDDKTGRVLHNGKKSRDQDNQLFRFVPVKDSRGNVKKNTYYILSKKGDNKGKELYIGLDGNKGIDLKRKVATTSNPMEWVVENATVDVPAKAERLPDKKGKTICMIYPQGYKRDINVSSDSKLNGAKLHLWLHGTSSKFDCMWDSNYKAYRLGGMTITEHSLGTVWDIKDRSYADGAAIHCWKQIGDSLSQYWRFISCGNGVYQIQNAYTGKYAALKETKDEDGVQLVTSSKPANWQVDVINVENQNAKAVKWMSELPDDTLLSNINIPGSHDTGTAWTTAYGLDLSDKESISISKCQQLFVEEQLNVGVRAFDLRADSFIDHDDPDIVHGSQIAQCRKQDYSKLSLKDVFQKTADFLKANPSETVIFKINHQGSGKVEDVAKSVDNFIQSGNYPIYKPDTLTVPSLGEVRGKIVLLRGFSFGSYKPVSKTSYFGIDMAGWGGDYDKIPGARQIYDKDGCEVWVQDAYTVNTTEKRSHFEKTIDQAASGEIPVGSYILNFTSCTNPTIIINNARNMTSWFLSRDARAYRQSKRVGIVLMDYIDAKMALAVYSNPPAEEIIFPKKASMAYGQSLSQAEVEGGSASGTFAFKEPETVPSNAGTKSYTMVYTPLDPQEPSIEQEVTVTVDKAVQNLKTNAASVKQEVGADAVKSKISGAKTALTFTSSNPDVAEIDENGKVQFKGVGKAVITVQAEESENYKAASLKWTVNVIPKTVDIKNLSSKQKGTIQCKIQNALQTNTGYELQYQINKEKKVYTKKLNKNAAKNLVLKNFPSGDTIRLRIRAYQVVDGRAYYGKYSKIQSVRIQ
ncbi:MAG: phosphatidylinositol-specific phospholipase C domain-containing protein [Eubacterium sp.]|nr:phosphatidylinositol-specific phospholipase C domain-containing protein [Eubacterium sp.]